MVFTSAGAQKHSAWPHCARRHPVCCRWYAGAREWYADSAPVARRSERQSIPLRAGVAPLARVPTTLRDTWLRTSLVLSTADLLGSSWISSPVSVQQELALAK